MQIKKGPFGYYALEKFDSPDRLCDYAEEVIAGNRSDFYLSPSTELIGSGAMCYFEFSGYIQITDPEFSVFSPGKRSASHKKEAKTLSLRRRSVGDLFYSFVKLLDNLIAPSCIVLDPDMIFTDTEGIAIKLCCLPVKSTPEDLCLSSLGSARLEKLLHCDFFKNIITEDEINALVFSVKENNEEMFLKLASMIKGTPDGSAAATGSLRGSDPGRTGTARGIRNMNRTEKDLLTACFSSLFSLIMLMYKLMLPSFLFFMLSVIILTFSMLNKKKIDEKEKKEKSEVISKQRSSVLFSETSSVPAEETVPSFDMNPDDRSPAEAQKHYSLLSSGKLSLISESRVIKPEFAVYLDETYIGSDCFLSDIVLDDNSVSPLHAVIKQENGSFFLMPSQGKGRTYIEDSPVENGRTYEIKSGQKITIGEIEFRFTV